ncbi:hypothetical protein IHO40_00635 [Wolbachia endosymbiont of Mansonella ozzardi]|uniref:hypothetical protein n=1 Tax=Wolbachia endosymbiont of Mansonella ozzardi TaxID=137464 RepID=UPI001CE206ED|nr:hypothetical protein [Wolbachia endosymbiont of Mansonella ozzardi]MCA4774690.1 hypothetical protein [Wolbachia endosymbiont of Mansonella ozzardi]
MPDSGNQSKKINGKWLAIGAGSLLLVMMLPPILLLAKIAIGLIVVPVVAIAMKVASKTISKVLEDKQEDQNQSTQKTTQSKIINLAIGLLSIFVGGLPLFTIAQIGSTATCAVVAALVSYACFKDREIGKNINDKLDEIAENTTDFIVSNIEKLIPQQSCQA